jgi:hypothetical protein
VTMMMIRRRGMSLRTLKVRVFVGFIMGSVSKRGCRCTASLPAVKFAGSLLQHPLVQVYLMEIRCLCGRDQVPVWMLMCMSSTRPVTAGLPGHVASELPLGAIVLTGLGGAAVWKGRMLERAGALFARRSVDLATLVYGPGVSEVSDWVCVRQPQVHATPCTTRRWRYGC